MDRASAGCGQTSVLVGAGGCWRLVAQGVVIATRGPREFRGVCFMLFGCHGFVSA